MAEIKTKPTAVTVEAFIAGIEAERRRDEARVLVDLMTCVSGQPAKMWGPSIIGFGSYDYRYDSGHKGTMCRIGFSPRKAAISLYLTCDAETLAEPLSRLGKTRHGRGCIYINKLADIDLAVLEEMIGVAWAAQTQAA